MTQEECLQSFRQVVAEAIVLGTKLSDQEYAGTLWDEGNRTVWDSFRELHERTEEFLKLTQLGTISADQVFPLHVEMKNNLEAKG